MTGPDVVPSQTWSSTQQVADAIAAMPDGSHVRVRGSGHSYPDQIRLPDPGGVLADLDPSQPIGNVATDGTITAWAGNHLGPDPRDPRADPTRNELFLLPWLHQQGRALPDTGGITHQTVGGFLSTGSSGGTLKYPLEQNILAIEFVDGTGEVIQVSRADGAADVNPFYAVGVSLGLLGVITHVTFATETKFSIKGQEAITTTADCEIDLFGPGTGPSHPSLADFFGSTDYARITWWPQQHVDRVAVWKAHRVDGDVKKQIPYQELGYSFNGALLAKYVDDDWQVIAGLISGLIDNSAQIAAQWAKTRPWLEGKVASDLLRQIDAIVAEESHEDLKLLLKDLANNQLSQQFVVWLYFSLLGQRTVPGSLAQAMFTSMFGSEDAFTSTWSHQLMNDLFITLDADKAPPDQGKPQHFQDYAYLGLPMDNQISDDLIATEFTELWVPMSQAQQVMQALKTFYAAPMGPGQGYARTGTYACEIYSAASSDFWLSPSFGEPVLRIDLYYFRYSSQPPDVAFYPQFWNLLQPFDFRPHWGKYLPAADGPQGASYLQKQYGEYLAKFLSMRSTADPKNLFLTDYWRQHLGITD